MSNDDKNFQAEEPGPIFVQPWWLDVVTEGKWEEIKIEKGGNLFARLPFYYQNKRGIKKITMPPLTQCMGPWVKENKNSIYANKLSREKEMMTKLINELPSVDWFHQHFHVNITNWLPFYWKGYRQTTRYTYIIHNIDDLENIWSQLKSNVRRNIKKANELLNIKYDLPLDDFWELNKMVFERQNMPVPYPKDLFLELDKACVKKECGKKFFAIDDKLKIHATLYLVWDNERAYYLIGGADPELRSSGATSLLMWEAIKFASSRVDSFDFEGSMLEPVESFVRHFNGHQTPYFSITKTSRKMEGIKSIKKLGKAILGK